MRGRRSGLKHTEFFLILIAIYLLVGETGLCDRVEECTPVEGGQLLDLMGSRFVLFEDVMQAPGFKTVTRWTEEPWLRRPFRASAVDCASLHSELKPVMLNTHAQLHKAGYIPMLPYMFREHCQRPSRGSSAGETALLASRSRAWVFKHGAMLGRCNGCKNQSTARVWCLYVQHPEYHSLSTWKPPEIAQLEAEPVERLVNLAQAHAHNFYHFLTEVVPRLLLLPPSLLRSPSWTLLLPPFPSSSSSSSSSHQHFIPLLLSLLHIDPSRALAAHYGSKLVFASHVIFPSFSPFQWHSQTPRRALSFTRTSLLHGLSQLVIASSQAVLEGETERHNQRHQPETATETETETGTETGTERERERERERESGGREYGLVSVRGEGEARGGEVSDVGNWAEVVARLRLEIGGGGLRSSAPPLLLLSVQCSLLSLLEQASLFSGASAVLGAHGSNVANALWMSPPSLLLEIHPPPSSPGPRYANFYHLSSALGLEYHMLVADEGFTLGADKIRSIAAVLRAHVRALAQSR